MPASEAVADEGGTSWPYRRVAGVWEYTWGGAVPGARDVGLQDLYGFEVGSDDAGAYVLVPSVLAGSTPELAWCVTWWDHRSRPDKIRVPQRAWDSHSKGVLGMSAPELMADRVLDTDGVAALAGMRPRTVANYLSRGLMPLPVLRVGGSPVWTAAVIERWLSERPGRPGRPRGALAARQWSEASERASTRRPAARTKPSRPSQSRGTVTKLHGRRTDQAVDDALTGSVVGTREVRPADQGDTPLCGHHPLDGDAALQPPIGLGPANAQELLDRVDAMLGLTDEELDDEEGSHHFL